ncbi:HipA family kinase [Curtobacterium sp. MCJR17_020]|uniref:HipA family kinase n=1 Tax=Curtobacterium sp. MCJR17_020 TaxID=2175619 RepID=UPI000DA7BBF5|nr:HipA family kinase [Curtobacterium sp. MCJR17_020]WIE71601.1 hypothetical protein DEJ14_015640 [Curtobacterium sp. MCJR17_020]
MTDERPIAVALRSVVAPLQISGSGAGAFLVLADDGEEYWVKAPNNPQGARSLIAERVVAGIGELIGAPVPDTALMAIPDDLRFEFKPGIRTNGGLGHGSLNVQPVVNSTDWGRFAPDDHNRERTASILGLWDLCLGFDEQWVHQSDEDNQIFTVDHGFWFGGGSDWTIADLQRVGTNAWDQDLDPGIASAVALRDAADRIDTLTLDMLRGVVDTVPVEWDTTPAELSELASILFVRAEGVAARLRTNAAHSRHR